MGFLTLAIALSGGAAESGELLELAHIGEADSRIAVGYVPLILGVEKGLRDHVVNYQQYKAALKACRSQ